MPRYFLGIDGGGTKTRAAIVDEQGELCGAGLGGPSNYDDVGVTVTQNSIKQAVDSARAAADQPATPFVAAFLGMAGVVSLEDRQNIRRVALDLSLALPERIGIDHDCRIALAGGLTGRAGIVLIAGTGSSCYGRNEAGESWRAGGWGHLISDEGSSYWLGIQAMRAATGMYDERVGETALLKAIQSQLKLEQMESIMHRLYVQAMSRAEIAALAPLVVDAAYAGDEQARLMIVQGAEALADCVLAVARHLGLDRGHSELALVGGLYKAGEVFTRPLYEALAARLPLCKPQAAEISPVLGACLLAMQLGDVGLDSNISALLAKSEHKL